MSKERNRRNKNTNQFIVQGSILAVVGILVRVIGLVKRIPLTNIIGDRGNGFYAAAYEIYSIVLLISSYSLPTAVSKMVSSRIAVGQYKNANRILKASLLFAVVSGAIASILVYLFADYLAGPIMLEPMSGLALKVLAPTLLVVAIMGVLRGYFQGIGTMIPTALSQVFEQIFTVIASLMGATILFEYGVVVGELLDNEYYAAAYGAAGGSFGPFVGAIIGLLILSLTYAAYRRPLHKKILRDRSKTVESYYTILPLIFAIIVPIILSTAIYNISNILDQRIYNQVMIAKGLEDIKTVHWGIYTGKYNVLTNIPIAFSSALCAATVPAITKSVSRGEWSEVGLQIKKVTKLTVIIAIPCAVAFMILAKDMLHLLFNDSTQLASGLLQVGSISIIFYSISTLTNGILQGINKMHIPVINAISSLIIHLLTLYALLTMTDLGIYAVVYSKIVFSLCMCLLNGFSLRRHLRTHIAMKRVVIVSTIAALGMGIILVGLVTLSTIIPREHKLIEVGIMGVICLIGGLTYLILLIQMRGITKRELLAIPGGRFLEPFLKK
ncbi:MAG: polysaccharide biosynthesis protein [Eubacteriales bacterium]